MHKTLKKFDETEGGWVNIQEASKMIGRSECHLRRLARGYLADEAGSIVKDRRKDGVMLISKHAIELLWVLCAMDDMVRSRDNAEAAVASFQALHGESKLASEIGLEGLDQGQMNKLKMLLAIVRSGAV
jgi:hypothetical protein